MYDFNNYFWLLFDCTRIFAALQVAGPYRLSACLGPLHAICGILSRNLVLSGFTRQGPRLTSKEQVGWGT